MSSKKVHDVTKIRYQRGVIKRLDDIAMSLKDENKLLKQALVDQAEKTQFWKGRWEKEKAKNGTITHTDNAPVDSDTGSVEGSQSPGERCREGVASESSSSGPELHRPDESGAGGCDTPEATPLSSEHDIRGSSDTEAAEQRGARSLDMPGVGAGETAEPACD